MSTVPKEKPILFSGEMVRAILDDRKTQTRRIIKPQPPNGCRYGINGNLSHACCIFDDPELPGGVGFCPPKIDSADHRVKCPYGTIGDQLWVRETWNCLHVASQVPIPPNPRPMVCSLAYAATEAERHAEYPHTSKLCCKWRPSIHMPRWASRITLEITDVRVEQLQDISGNDAVDEGIVPRFLTDQDIDGFWDTKAAISRFRELWQSINGPESWDLNPWVWVVEFKRVKP